MKSLLEQEFNAALVQAGIDVKGVNHSVDWSKRIEHGHFASNIAMILAKPLKKAPIELNF